MSDTPSPTTILSLRELARRTGMNVNAVRRWRDEQGLRVYKLDRRRQAVLWSDFCEWLQSREIENGKVKQER
jgi:hypothetical protein